MMKTVTGSALKVSSLVKYNEKYRSCFWCPRDAAVWSSRPEIHFLGCAKKNVNVSFSQLSVSSQRELIHPILSASAFSSSDTQTHIQDEEMQIPDENQSKTVHVKFQLQKECMFGQHFFIVGDDPIFGLWDPSQAIPMNWSDGHVWTVELDIPIGKLIKYKFVLKRGEYTVLWQPGEDRVLQTWETSKTIMVIEDWDNSEIQKIIEEEPSTEPSKEYAVDSELLMVADNLTLSSGNLEDEVNKELSNASSYSISNEKSSLENIMPTIAAITTEQKGELEVPGARTDTYTKKSEVAGVNTSDSNGRAINGEILLVPDNKTNLVCEEEFPVLVPGLTAMPAFDEPSVHAVEENAVADISLGSDKAEELSVSELNLKDEAAIDQTSDPQEVSEMVFNGKQELDEDEHIDEPQLVEGKEQHFNQSTENNVLEDDMQWGRRTLQKFLMNFGLL